MQFPSRGLEARRTDMRELSQTHTVLETLPIQWDWGGGSGDKSGLEAKDEGRMEGAETAESTKSQDNGASWRDVLALCAWCEKSAGHSPWWRTPWIF
ncbi:MAG: hypothetical protein JWN34_3856 [Bryobacterales bacterium]|nr:hypothetical protein [Bryobacterales bacterium]